MLERVFVEEEEIGADQANGTSPMRSKERGHRCRRYAEQKISAYLLHLGEVNGNSYVGARRVPKSI